MKVFAAVKAVIVREGRFLVIKQGDYGVWDLPGGKIEYGESPFDTLKREVKEEVNLDIEIIKTAGVWWFFRQSDKAQVICTTFLADAEGDIDIEKNPADENITEYRWVKKEEALELMLTHESLSDLLKNIENFL